MCTVNKIKSDRSAGYITISFLASKLHNFKTKQRNLIISDFQRWLTLGEIGTSSMNSLSSFVRSVDTTIFLSFRKSVAGNYYYYQYSYYSFYVVTIVRWESFTFYYFPAQGTGLFWSSFEFEFAFWTV